MAELTEAQLDQMRQALGIGPEVPNSDIEELASTSAGQAILKKVESQPSGGGGPGLLGEAGQFITNLPGAAERTGTDIGTGLNKTVGPGNTPSWIAENIGALGVPAGIKAIVDAAKGGGGGGGPAPKKAAKKGKGENQQTALEQLAQWLTSNYVEQGALAMGQQGQELAQQNQYVTGLVDQQFQQAGAAAGDPAVQAAMDAYTKAYSGGEALNSLGYANMGKANAQYLQESPLYPIANLLTQGFGSTQYKELPANVVQGLPSSVQAALAQAGITESTTAGGSGVPISVPKGANSGGAQNLAQILGLNNPATNPLINASIGQTTTPGTASNPTS